MSKSKEKWWWKINEYASTKTMEMGKSKKSSKRKQLKDIKSQTDDSDPKSLKPWNTFWAL